MTQYCFYGNNVMLRYIFVCLLYAALFVSIYGAIYIVFELF